MKFLERVAAWMEANPHAGDGVARVIGGIFGVGVVVLFALWIFTRVQ